MASSEVSHWDCGDSSPILKSVCAYLIVCAALGISIFRLAGIGGTGIQLSPLHFSETVNGSTALRTHKNLGHIPCKPQTVNKIETTMFGALKGPDGFLL